MTNFCAFLRGVNVKGTNMKMADVCKVFSDTGVQNVSSVLASGNILFQSDKDSIELKKILEKQCQAISITKLFSLLRTKTKSTTF